MNFKLKFVGGGRWVTCSSWHGTNGRLNILFVQKIIFIVEAILDKQNDRIYARTSAEDMKKIDRV